MTHSKLAILKVLPQALLIGEKRTTEKQKSISHERKRKTEEEEESMRCLLQERGKGSTERLRDNMESREEGEGV